MKGEDVFGKGKL